MCRVRIDTGPEPPPGLLGSKTLCTLPAECAEPAARTLLEAERWLGSPHMVVLAAQDPEIERLVLSKYIELAGKPFHGRTGAYRSVLARSRKGVWRLMDLGYLVVVARARPRTLEALSRLEEYPYRSLFLYTGQER